MNWRPADSGPLLSPVRRAKRFAPGSLVVAPRGASLRRRGQATTAVSTVFWAPRRGAAWLLDTAASCCWMSRPRAPRQLRYCWLRMEPKLQGAASRAANEEAADVPRVVDRTPSPFRISVYGSGPAHRRGY